MSETLERVEYEIGRNGAYLNTEGVLDASKQSVVIPVPQWAEITLQCYRTSDTAEFQILVTANKHGTIQNGTPRWFSIGTNKTDHIQIVLPSKISGIKLVRISGTIEWAVVAA